MDIIYPVRIQQPVVAALKEDGRACQWFANYELDRSPYDQQQARAISAPISTEIWPDNFSRGTDVDATLVQNGVNWRERRSLRSLTALTNKPLELRPSVRYTETVRGGSHKSWREAQESGKILLRPMTRYNAEVADAMVIRLPETPLLEATNAYWHVNEKPTPTPVWCGRPIDGYGVLPSHSDIRIPLSSQDAAPVFYAYAQDVHAYSLFSVHDAPNVRAIVERLMATPLPPGLGNAALNELHDTAFDVLTELGELPETVKYIYSTLKRIIQLFISFKKRESAAKKKYHAKDLVDEISSLWMQFRYAVSPLAYSIEDALQLASAREMEYISVRKRQDIPVEFATGSYRVKADVEVRVFAKARVDLSATSRQLGLNPAKTLWELTPLSFVVDWVLPIGDLLGALVPPSSLSQRALSVSRRVRKVEIHYKDAMDEVLLDSRFDLYSSEVVQALEALSPLPVDLNMTWKRALDALSLSWSMFLKQHWKS